jgi:predicted AlkP superfamily pyrophosphatase or phosphodiesterase
VDSSYFFRRAERSFCTSQRRNRRTLWFMHRWTKAVSLRGTLSRSAILLVAAMSLHAQTRDANPFPSRPKLIVVIVVDQMRADYIERFHNRWTGGLRRILDQGAWMSRAAYPYTVTETCPGHATVSTGVLPSVHGIIGNMWWDRQAAARVTCTQDASVRVVGANRAGAGDSAASLEARSLAEQIRSAIPGSRSVTMSAKARAAAMLAGHRADASLWLDESTGELLSSTAYGDSLPAFAKRFVEANPVAADFSQVWQLSAPLESYKGGRSVRGEGPPSGWTTSFPHPLSAGEKAPGPAFVARWRASPFADLWLARLAAAAVEQMKLGRSGGVDFLGIGFSATDYIGHGFGPDSREIEDDLLVLDRTIGTLLETLDRSVGVGEYLLALTADHGVAPIPEQAREQGQDAGRADPRELVDRIESALAGRIGSGHSVAQFVAPELYLMPGVVSRLDSDPALWSAIQRAALVQPGVAYITRRNGAASAKLTKTLAQATAADAYPERSGDLWIGLKPGWIFSGVSATGTTHGTANDYDRHVPILLFGKGIKHGQYTSTASPADIAPTLASLSGLRIERTDGRILREALLTPAPAPVR